MGDDADVVRLVAADRDLAGDSFRAAEEDPAQDPRRIGPLSCRNAPVARSHHGRVCGNTDANPSSARSCGFVARFSTAPALARR